MRSDSCESAASSPIPIGTQNILTLSMYPAFFRSFRLKPRSKSWREQTDFGGLIESMSVSSVTLSMPSTASIMARSLPSFSRFSLGSNSLNSICGEPLGRAFRSA